MGFTASYVLSLGSRARQADGCIWQKEATWIRGPARSWGASTSETGKTLFIDLHSKFHDQTRRGLCCGAISCARLPLGWVLLGHTASGNCHQPSSHMGLGSHSSWGYDSVPSSGMGKAGCSRSSKTTPLRTRIRPICLPLSSLVSVPQLDSADEQSRWLGYYLGTAVMNSVCQDLELVLIKLPPSPSLSGFQYWALHIPLQFMWWEIRVGAPMKWPTMLREAGCPSWVISLWRNQRLCVVLCYTGKMQLMYSCFSYSSNLVCLGLWAIGGVSASPLCSRIPSVLSCTWIDISSSCEKEQSEEWPMSPSWWHYSKSSFLNSQHFLLYFLVLIFKKALCQPALVTYFR